MEVHFRKQEATPGCYSGGGGCDESWKHLLRQKYSTESVEDARMGKFSSINVVTTPYVHLEFFIS